MKPRRRPSQANEVASVYGYATAGGTDTAHLYDAVLESGRVEYSDVDVLLWLAQFDQIDEHAPSVGAEADRDSTFTPGVRTCHVLTVADEVAVAQEAIRAADETEGVADIANGWGFWHMGQFAADYRRQFGELPSETLARRAGTKA